MTARRPARPFRSRDWFADPHRSDMTALYLERFMNYGVTPDELRSGRPIIGIAQTGSDLSPCNRIHLELAQRVRDGIRDAGGIPMEYPVHPIFENCRRPTAALDRNLSYLGQVEMHGYPIDAVVLTTGCDKTTPAGIMATVLSTRTAGGFHRRDAGSLCAQRRIGQGRVRPAQPPQRQSASRRRSGRRAAASAALECRLPLRD